jgi:hypothetical protein
VLVVGIQDDVLAGEDQVGRKSEWHAAGGDVPGEG